MVWPTTTRAVVTLGIALWACDSHAGLLKWVKKEALPTISGRRPVEIKPYISVKSGSTQVRLGQDSAMIKVGGVTVQTGKLRLRLAQAACVYATGGDVMTCAPDVIQREASKLFDEIASGIDTTAGPTNANAGHGAGSSGSSGSTGGLKFEDGGMKEVPWGPPSVSVGFDFSNPGTPSSSPPKPSAFLHTIAVARGVDSSGRAMVGIVGRADFAFMPGRKGGILCLFASEKGKYLRDRNGQYSDPYGLVALGGSAVVNLSPDLMPIQLSMPWAELDLPDDVDPYAPKFVQCHITVDNQVMQSTEWIVF